MIQFNLLPDVKLQFARTQRTKRMIFVVSIVVGGASLAVLVLMFMVVNVFQKQHMNSLHSDITASRSQLESITDLDKILTVQNQLTSLTCVTDEDFASKPCLHDKKPVTSRLFGYLSRIVPDKVNIADLSVDFDQKTMQFTGAAQSLGDVNKFVDTLKFTVYKGSDGKSANAFTNVVLSSFEKAETEINYTVNLNYDQAIFDSRTAVNLDVPSKTTTRSELEKPGDLFKEQTTPIDNTGGVNP